jgi:hypothetical protein
MMDRSRVSSAAALLLLLQGCTHTNLRQALRQDVAASDAQTRILAVYEPWFGHPQHISVGYSSHDPVVIRKQIEEAKSLGISGFVVDWYGDREPFLDRSYALVQSLAAESNFHVAMMYDESEGENGSATDDTLAAFDKFQRTYLTPDAPGHQAYLMYRGRPMIFIFPKGGNTDWNKVRAQVNQWNPSPLLIYEEQSTPYTSDFDGFYAWINPGGKGWAADGSNWGEDYLRDFYQTMQSKYPHKITVGAAWASFDDRRASWGLNRRISPRCGQTLTDTWRLSRSYDSGKGHALPFLLIETWNDYEEGTAIEAGGTKCN